MKISDNKIIQVDRYSSKVKLAHYVDTAIYVICEDSVAKYLTSEKLSFSKFQLPWLTIENYVNYVEKQMDDVGSTYHDRTIEYYENIETDQVKLRTALLNYFTYQ